LNPVPALDNNLTKITLAFAFFAMLIKTRKDGEREGSVKNKQTPLFKQTKKLSFSDKIGV
jgi:hypothetical protein